jgi:hypothetical protein
VFAPDTCVDTRPAASCDLVNEERVGERLEPARNLRHNNQASPDRASSEAVEARDVRLSLAGSRLMRTGDFELTFHCAFEGRERLVTVRILGGLAQDQPERIWGTACSAPVLFRRVYGVGRGSARVRRHGGGRTLDARVAASYRDSTKRTGLYVSRLAEARRECHR